MKYINLILLVIFIILSVFGYMIFDLKKKMKNISKNSYFSQRAGFRGIKK